MDSSVAEACQCAKIFAALIQLTKTHTDKQVGNHQGLTENWETLVDILGMESLSITEASSWVLQVHMQAVRCGGRFVEVFMKLAKFWKALVQGDDTGAEQFTELAHDMQKGTRVMQILCSEAKCRKELGIVAKVDLLPCSHRSTPRCCSET